MKRSLSRVASIAAIAQPISALLLLYFYITHVVEPIVSCALAGNLIIFLFLIIPPTLIVVLNVNALLIASRSSLSRFYFLGGTTLLASFVFFLLLIDFDTILSLKMILYGTGFFSFCTLAIVLYHLKVS